MRIRKVAASIRGDKALWQAVLNRAMRDAIAVLPGEKRKAMRWLFTDQYKADRDMVCDYAGINFDVWRDELLAIITKLDKEKRYQGRTSGSVAQYIANMFVRHGND